MYNNVYQEYINNMLGMQPKIQSDFEYDTYRNSNIFQNQNSTNIEFEKFYPDLYKLLYPMIQTVCMRNTKPITEETIDEMVKDIYSNFSTDEEVVLNINLTNDVKSNKMVESQKNTSNKLTTKTMPLEARNAENKEERNLRPNNYVLKDLIRILLIRELIGRPGNIPPFRPGFPPRPGLGNLHFRQSNIPFNVQNYDIYEHMNI